MLRAVLIDDEERSLNSLYNKIVQHCPEVTVIAACNTPQKGIDAIEQWKPNLVFLDIEMPVMNGFNLLQMLTYKNFQLIFVTAYDHYAIQAIRYSALDYLVKPVEVEELKTAVARAAVEAAHTSGEQFNLLLEHLLPESIMSKKIAIPTSESVQFIKINDIIYLEASINYTKIFVSGDIKYLASKTLKDFEEMLPSVVFIRIHNSYIINKNHVDKYVRGDGGQVLLSNGVMLDVSKRKKTEFLKLIGY